MDGFSAYKENEILTQPPEKLVVMLYEGAIKFLRQAAAAMAEQRHEEKARLISRAQAIIDELNVSLDMEAGGEVAVNLRSLYNFMTRHLSQAVARGDPQMIRDVIACLEDLLQGWKAISG